MGIIILIIHFILLAILIFGNKQSKRRFLTNPLFLYLCVWTAIILFSCIHIYDIIPPSDQAYILIGMMSCFFFVGCFSAILLSKYHKKTPKKTLPKNSLATWTKKLELHHETLEKIFYIISYIILVVNVIDCIIVLIHYLNGAQLWEIRNWTLAPIGSDNPIIGSRSLIEIAFRKVILTPLSTLIMPISFYLFFNYKKKLPIILSSLIALTSSIAGAGGRLGLIVYLGFGILAYTLYHEKRSDKKRKNLIRAVLAGILVVALVIGFTVFRSGLGSFIKQAYTYIALTPTLLSLWLPIVSSQAPTYGLLTTFGIHSYVFRGFKAIGLGALVPASFDRAYNTLLQAESWMPVGYRDANAFVSPVYYFMADGGPLFVCLASFVFGFLIYRFYIKCESKKTYSLRNFAILCLIMYGVFISFARIQTAIPSFILSLILTIFLPNGKQAHKEKYHE